MAVETFQWNGHEWEFAGRKVVLCPENGAERRDVGLECQGEDYGFDLAMVDIRLAWPSCVLEAWLRLWWKVHPWQVRPRQNDQLSPQESSNEWW